MTLAISSIYSCRRKAAANIVEPNRFERRESRYAAIPGLTPISGRVCRKLAVCPRLCPAGNISWHRPAPPSPARGKSDECAHKGQRANVSELQDGPLPSAGLAAPHCHRRHALHGEGEEDQQRDGAAQSQILPQRALQ